jgi:predicted nucleotide-binding protein (sugar kinase/HSP70/actin superfamily)/activator of 2-hydroxyglutaryl-CoA dehydratase
VAVRAGAGPPLVARADELDAFRREYAIRVFRPPQLEASQTVRAAIGLDGGSTSSKAVLVSADGAVLAKSYRLSRGNPLRDMQDLLADLQTQVERCGAVLDVLGFGATGYAADVLEEALAADANIVETVAHAQSAVHFCGELDVICDIGGQDIKVLLLENGEIRDFRLSNQCSAGNGMLLQAMADQFGVPMTEYAETAFAARQTPVFSYGCAVFLDSDRVNFQKEGYSRDELLAGLAMVLPKNVWQYVVQIPRLATLGRRFVLQGGTQYNLAAVKAQVDYIRSRVPDAEVRLHPHPGEAGAIGAALEALRVVGRRGHSTFIGLNAALELQYTTRNDESTRCRFCPNLCSRTFVETSTPEGRASRYISGFSCEKGTVESKEEVRRLVQQRNELKAKHVNLVEYEARLAFRSFCQPQPLPAAGTPIDDLEVRASWWRGVRRRRVRRGFARSDSSAADRRRRLRIGLPRVLNMYSMGPLFRTYFEALGVPAANVIFSPPTSEELYQAGAKYGAVDPCFPAKVGQAHLHHLLHHVHQPERPLDYIFFPSLTHVPTFVENTMDATTCPIVAGTPNVIKAAFTRELDFFAERGVDYVDGPLTPTEPVYFRRQMFELWGERLDVTEDESDFAVEQGFEALRRFDADLQRRGLEVLEQAETENRVALLVIGRPYHNDPGLNHGVLEQFQALGYPVLSIRSIPKDPAWLGRWFADDLASGRIASSLDINDVWPENYSTNSVQKVWAAKFAARHPHVAVLDLSSFKCGHDAPTYGLIAEIIKAGGKPYMALHDLDANKPAGSLKIRVKTYAAALARYQEELADRAARQSELERRLVLKRRELIAARHRALAVAGRSDPGLAREIEEMSRAFQHYVNEDEAVLGMAAADLDRGFPSERPQHDQTADVAPLPPGTQLVGTLVRPRALSELFPIAGPAAAGCGSGCASGGCSSGGCGAGFSTSQLVALRM